MVLMNKAIPANLLEREKSVYHVLLLLELEMVNAG